MEQRLENSTLIALRELRGYEHERRLAERRKKEDETRQARERKEQERLAEEAARERALEKQLRTELQRAEEEIRLLRQEADRRMREAAHALQAVQAPTSAARTSSLPAPAPRPRRRTWLAALGCTALVASALGLAIGRPRDASMHVEVSGRNASCPGPVAPVASPMTVAVAPPPEVHTPQGARSGSVEGGRQHPTTPRRRSGMPHPPRRPNPPKPACDGTDPLCGLDVSTMTP